MAHQSTILIVDDQLSAREVLRGLLLGEDYHMVFADDGPEALAKATQYTLDLILLDVMMPGIDGFEVCRQLRADPHLAEVPVIMVTSLDDRESRLKGLEAGADDFIAKPFDRAELRARVKTITRLNAHRRLRAMELQAERDRTRSILEALGETVIVTNANGIIVYVNPAAAKLTGFALPEILGQSWPVWQNLQPELYAAILQTIQQGQTWQGEVTNTRTDNSEYSVALTVAPVFSMDDYEMGLVSVQRDITPLKQAERSKNEFVSNVSHELRTPLSVITLLSDNLESLYARLPDDRRLKMVRDIQKHTQILNDLIGDVLEISRIDSGRMSMERERLNFSQLVREQTRELMPLVQQKMQTLQVQGVPVLGVMGNAAQLKQVIRNLLNNAIKYTPDGGQIDCDCRPVTAPAADLAAEWPGIDQLAAGEWAAFRVTDTGVGIAAEHLERLFERFYRVKSEQPIRGTGLGLAIARQLVELHQGQIAVASRLGQGSTFAVYLPLLAQNSMLA